MTKIEWKVEKTPCFPHEWFGGPTWNGTRMSNSTCYYFYTAKEAREYVEKMRKLSPVS